MLRTTLFAVVAGLLTLNAHAAVFTTQHAALRPGQQVTSPSPTNGNQTVFHFVEVTRNPESRAVAAWVQWAPLAPKAVKYRNGTVIDAGTATRLWINGVWYSVRFDGEQVEIR